MQRVDSEGIAPDYTGPWDMTLGYLPYYMQGMDMGVLKNEVSDAAAQIGFRCEKRTELLCSGWQDIGILRKIEKYSKRHKYFLFIIMAICDIIGSEVYYEYPKIYIRQTIFD